MAPIRSLRSVRAVVALAVLAALAGSAVAGAPSIGYTGNGGVINGGAIDSGPHSWRAFMGGGAPAPGSVIVTDGVSAQVGGRTANMALARTIPWSGVAGLATRALPTVAVGWALYDIWNNLRSRPDGYGGMVHDDGIDPEAIQQCHTNRFTTPTHDGMVCFPTSVAAQNDVKTYVETYSGTCTWEEGPASYNNGPHTQSGNGVLRCVHPIQGLNFVLTSSIREDDALSDMPCPAAVDALNPALSYAYGHARSPDGKCRTGRYNAKGAAFFEGLFDQYGPKDRAREIVQDTAGRGIDAAPFANPIGGTASGPASVAGTPTTTTTTAPNGTTTTTTTTPSQAITYNNNTYTYVTTVTTTVNNGGSTGTTTTTTEGPPAAAQDIETCGLPGKPACKIDETGTPDPEAKNAEADVNAKTQATKDAIANPTGTWGPFPDINWSFSLPTGCGVIPTPAFAPALTGIDICQFQGIFHTIMAAIWMLGGLFGAIGIFWRDQLATP